VGKAMRLVWPRRPRVPRATQRRAARVPFAVE
jgi:hypothetical protein